MDSEYFEGRFFTKCACKSTFFLSVCTHEVDLGGGNSNLLGKLDNWVLVFRRFADGMHKKIVQSYAMRAPRIARVAGLAYV